MWEFLQWWMTLLLLGWILFPLTYKLFSTLPNRGYGFSKTIALILGAYLFWIFVTFGLLPNQPASALGILFLLIIVGILIYKSSGEDTPFSWVKKNWREVLFVEILFLFAFGMWTFIRASNPHIVGTEKPMELAFINAILRSPAFPPADPWLSGYAISYYYFGYVIVAWLIQLIGTNSSVAYNLSVAMVFALVASNAQCILHALLASRKIRNLNMNTENGRNPFSFRMGVITLLAPLCILVVSNAEGFLEILHNKGLFWDNTYTQSSVWEWFDIRELNKPPTPPFILEPEGTGRVWWWRASRVLEDTTALGESRDIIDEFPYFSFWLADLHPHVLSIPIILLLIGVGISMYHTSWYEISTHINLRKWYRMPIFIFISLIFGILAFTNMWDVPICMLFVFGVLLLNILRHRSLNFSDIRTTAFFTIISVVNGVIFVIPYFLGFASQAGGLLPSMIFFTKDSHFLVMFFPLLVLITIYLLSLKRELRFVYRSTAIVLVLLIISFLGMFFLAGLFGGVPSWILNNSFFRNIIGTRLNEFQQAANAFLGVFQTTSFSELISKTFSNRLLQPGVISFTALLGILCWSRWLTRFHDTQKVAGDLEVISTHEDIFLLFTVSGLTIVLIPEFVYLRDAFGWRMNTIFKFYYQAWIFWGLASSVALAALWIDWRGRFHQLVLFICFIAVGTGLVYPFFTLRERIKQSTQTSLTLDGNDYIARYYPDLSKAINGLIHLPYGTILEAVGGNYTNYARIATLTGYPNVLGWPGHEMQWRGGVREIGSRESDIRQIYEISDWGTTQELISKYNIRYIIVSDLERSTYIVDENKISSNASQVFASPQINIYAVY